MAQDEYPCTKHAFEVLGPHEMVDGMYSWRDGYIMVSVELMADKPALELFFKRLIRKGLEKKFN